MGERLDRRLVAVMFTDMAGYTALMQADEHLAVDRRDRYVSALERHHDAFGGTIVQRLGDGSMSMFPSSLAAVMAGIAIQRELAALQIPVRIGVHVGEVIVEPERLTGDAVNLAARIESFAVPGGVMLSDSAYEQIRNRGDIGVVGLGRFRLKNGISDARRGRFLLSVRLVRCRRWRECPTYLPWPTERVEYPRRELRANRSWPRYTQNHR